jgi:dihydroneopterin aldolase
MRTSTAAVRIRTSTVEWLYITGIHFECTIGVTPRERSIRQTIRVDLAISLDFAAVKQSDSIQDTVDYREVCRALVSAGEKSSFQLIEGLASHLARTLVSGFPPIHEVRVELWKPGALSGAESVGVLAIETAPQARGKVRHSTKMS